MFSLSAILTLDRLEYPALPLQKLHLLGRRHRVAVPGVRLEVLGVIGGHLLEFIPSGGGDAVVGVVAVGAEGAEALHDGAVAGAPGGQCE